MKVLENNYLRLAWLPILEALFPPEEEIRLIAGESINKLSTEAKKDQYSDKRVYVALKLTHDWYLTLKTLNLIWLLVSLNRRARMLKSLVMKTN
jgi:hypothetical protein